VDKSGQVVSFSNSSLNDVQWISEDEIAAGFSDGTINIFKLDQAEPVKTIRYQVVSLMNHSHTSIQ
jgi:hypothetical protein